MHKIKGRIKIETFIITALFLLNSNIVFSQFYPDDVFENKCALCHTIGGGDLKGPDLLGVNERRPQEWLIRFVRSSNTLIKEGDPLAIELFEKYNKTEMQDWNYSDSEIIELLDYIGSFGASGGGGDGAMAESDLAGKDTVDILMDKLNELFAYYETKLKENISKDDISKGKALFLGDITFKNGAEACINCHNINEVDSLDRHPSAYDITQSTDYELKTVLEKPASIIMREAFREHPLTKLEIEYLIYYLDTVKQTGLIKPKETNFRFIIFIGVIVLLLLTLVDIKRTKLIQKTIIHYVIMLLAICYLTREVYIEASRLSLSKGYEPEQPVKFSHKTHAGDNQINCLYCHSTAEYSKVANIPSANLCLNCHKAIKSSSTYGKYEINKISEAIKTGTPIKWVKVHNLPDHVFFSHAQHVTVGKRECEECHGKVEEMDRLKQVNDLSMGWCLDCHKDTEVNKDNGYYKNLLERHDELASSSLKQNVVDFGGNDCQKCHY